MQAFLRSRRPKSLEHRWGAEEFAQQETLERLPSLDEDDGMVEEKIATEFDSPLLGRSMELGLDWMKFPVEVQTQFSGLQDYTIDLDSDKRLIGSGSLRALGISVERPSSADGLITCDPFLSLFDFGTALQEEPVGFVFEMGASERPENSQGPDMSPAAADTIPPIVSKAAAVQTPRPRRPFSTSPLASRSTAELETLQSAVNPVLDSLDPLRSNETFDESSAGSHRSSMSSVVPGSNKSKASESKRQSLAESIPMQLDTPSLCHAAVSTTSFKQAGGNSRTLSGNRQSGSSFRSATSTMDFNKPLPPDPSVPKSVTITCTEDFIQSDTADVWGSPPPRVYGNESPTLGTSQDTRPGQMNSPVPGGSFRLRSKYTPKDLDALDDAFQRSTPVIGVSSSSYSSAAHSRVSLAVDVQTPTIKGFPPKTSPQMLSANDPGQLSGSPMHKGRCRRAPPPPVQLPPRVHSPLPTLNMLEKPVFSVKRAQSSNALSSCRKHDSGIQRAATLLSGSSAKAHKILGESTIPSPARQSCNMALHVDEGLSERLLVFGVSTESPRSPQPKDDGANADPKHAGGDTHFEEIRKRLELLSPKRVVNKPVGSIRRRRASPAELPADHHVSRATAQLAELEATCQLSPVALHHAEPVELPASDDHPSVSVHLPMPGPPYMLVVPPIQVERRARKDVKGSHSSLAAKRKSVRSTRSVRGRSLASLAASEIPDIYASLPSPADASGRSSMAMDETDEPVSADAAEQILLRIMQGLDNLKDLFATAQVSRGFYRTFKRHELPLLKHTLFKMSPAAWELRQMSVPLAELGEGESDYTPELYLRYYVRDLLTIVELKPLILDHCKSFLRTDTIAGLAGETERSPFIDDAFWRVWTFCRLFGCGTNREDDIVGQMDWLRGGPLANQSTDVNTLNMVDSLSMNSVLFQPPTGFARGNRNGLTADELYDMTEIWTCLGVLVRGYHGKRREAREYGIFDGANLTSADPAKEDAIIEEWTYHLLTMAPSSVLDVTSPATPTRATFESIRAQGYTRWTPPPPDASLSTFLKEAVSRVYQQQTALRRPALVHSPSSFSQLQYSTSSARVQYRHESFTPSLSTRQRVKAFASELRARKKDPQYKHVPVSEDRPMSNYRDVLTRLEERITADTSAPPVPALPTLAIKFNLRKVKIGSHSPKERQESSPAASPTSTVSPLYPKTSRQGTGRLASLREKFEQRSSAGDRSAREGRKSKGYIGTQLRMGITGPPPITRVPEEKESLYPGANFVPTGPQVRDPVDLAVERLLCMGFDEAKAKKALAETDTGNSISFEMALNKLMQERKRKEGLQRLKRMG